MKTNTKARKHTQENECLLITQYINYTEGGKCWNNGKRPQFTTLKATIRKSLTRVEATSTFGSQSITGRRHSKHQGFGTGMLKNSTIAMCVEQNEEG